MATEKYNSDQRQWIDHNYFRTYFIAQEVERIARNPEGRAHDLESLIMDRGILNFAHSWRKDTVVHKFARWVAHHEFIEDISGPYAIVYDISDTGASTVKRHLPVSLALVAYGLASEGDAFEVPPPHGEIVQIRENVQTWKESNVVADACYDYFMNDLQLSEAYEKLLNRIADEVFHVMFLNRAALAGLNEYLARYISEVDNDWFEEDEAALSSLFLKTGHRLKRKSIPIWVRRAVFFREHGRCALCGLDLTGLIDALPKDQFDHIVPLSKGGLNDVTNIQLLCRPCNAWKSDKEILPSRRYRRWYELESK